MNIEQIRSFFFKAMMAGWINGGQFTPSLDAPGYKSFSFKDGDFTIGGLLRGHIVALCGGRGGLRSVTTATSRSRERVGASLLIVEGTREWLPTSVACAA